MCWKLWVLKQLTFGQTSFLDGRVGLATEIHWHPGSLADREQRHRPMIGNKIFFICLFSFLRSPSATRLSRGRDLRLTSDNFTCYHKETERQGHDFCLSRSYCTDTDPTSKEWAPEAGMKPITP